MPECMWDQMSNSQNLCQIRYQMSEKYAAEGISRRTYLQQFVTCCKCRIIKHYICHFNNFEQVLKLDQFTSGPPRAHWPPRNYGFVSNIGHWYPIGVSSWVELDMRTDSLWVWNIKTRGWFDSKWTLENKCLRRVVPWNSPTAAHPEEHGTHLGSLQQGGPWTAEIVQG